MTKWLLAIFAGSHTAALFLWVDVSLSVVGRNPSFSPPPLCCAAVGLSHSDGEMRGVEKHSHADICSADTKRCEDRKENKLCCAKFKDKLSLENHSVLILSTIWTKIGLHQETVHSEVQAYTTAEWRSRVCLDLEMWVRWDDCILPLERQRHIERARDWEKCMCRKTNKQHFPFYFLKITQSKSSLMLNQSIHCKMWMNHLLLEA